MSGGERCDEILRLIDEAIGGRDLPTGRPRFSEGVRTSGELVVRGARRVVQETAT